MLDAKSSIRPSVIQLNIKERAALFISYIPAFTHGGIFIPSTRTHILGEEVYILLMLPETADRFPIVGKVGWITPARAAKPQGVGIYFPGDEKSQAVKRRIEELLGSYLNTENPNQTF